MLSPELQLWVQERDPGTAAEAASLEDVFVATWRKNQPWVEKPVFSYLPAWSLTQLVYVLVLSPPLFLYLLIT